MPAPEFSKEEFLATVLARAVAGSRTVGVGSNSPIPAAAALLARARAGGSLEAIVLGSREFWPFTDGGRELFDFAAQGRLDSFFLGGGQIDGAGNVNLVSVGGYPAGAQRFPGSFGSAYLYALVPNVVLFREEHSARVLVERVDFISAAGVGPEGAYRTGGPRLLVTGRAVFRFASGAFSLLSYHPGESVESIRAATGFAFSLEPDLHETRAPAPEDIALLRGPIAEALRPVYPRFVARVLSGAASGGGGV
jgi:glutaconate CoA-transferase, subunit B